MKFILVPLIVYSFNQLLKFFVLLARNRKIRGSRFIWTFLWVGSFPSAHTAVLVSSLYLVGQSQGLGALFGFCFFLVLVIITGLLEDQKRELIYESYFVKSHDVMLKKIVKDKILLDFSGHSFLEIIFGAAEGVIFTFLITQYLIKL